MTNKSEDKKHQDLIELREQIQLQKDILDIRIKRLKKKIEEEKDGEDWWKE
jgi:hypothetical protein